MPGRMFDSIHNYSVRDENYYYTPIEMYFYLDEYEHEKNKNTLRSHWF